MLFRSVKEGRHIYDNIKKFILYLLSCNSAEIYVMLLCGIIGLPVPFTPIMILWVNLVADIPPALSLGVDPPEVDVMTRLPRDPRKNIFNWKTVGLLLYQGFSIAGLTVGIYAACLYIEVPEALRLGYGGLAEFGSSESSGALLSAMLGLERAQTLALVTMTFAQLVHAFLSRSVRSSAFNKYILSNRWLVGGVVLSSVLMVAGVYIPHVNTILGQVALPALDWAKVVGTCILHIIFVELFKVFLRKCKCGRPQTRSIFYDEV